MSYRSAKASDIEQVELAKQALVEVVPSADREEFLRQASRELHAVLSRGETADFTREALMVIIVQALMDKYEGTKGDHALANEVTRYVGHPDLKCDRNRVYRIRHKYGLEPRLTEPDERVPVAIELPGSGRVQVPRADAVSRILDDPFYVRRPADLMLEALSQELGETIIIKAPRGFGATRLIERYTALCQRAHKHVAVIDLSLGELVGAASYAEMLDTLATLMLRKFGLTAAIDERIATQLDMTYFVEDKILAKLGGPCTLVLERSERFLGRRFTNDFFSMLRYWHNSRSAVNSRWRLVDLVLATSVDPMRFITDHARSPFAVGRTVTLGLFDESACRALDQQTGTGLSERELAELYQQTAGHPYLLWRAFKELHLGLPFATLMRTAAHRDGPFREHLVQIEHALEHRHQLAETYRALVLSGREPSREDALELLEAGLVRRQEGALVPLCPIYAAYFRERLS